MLEVQDLTGQKFGKLTVVRLDHKEQKYKKNGTKDGFEYYWLCRCECGKEKVLRKLDFKYGNTKSCGCLRKEKRIIKHGLTHTRLFNIWSNLKQRCNNPNASGYDCYGGRGITYCKEWENFEPFMNWAVFNGYTDDLTIDRINVNGNYEPDNCRWITIKEQMNNMRSNRLITYNGETHNLKQWSEIVNITYTTLHWRLSNGWSIEKVLTHNIKNKKEKLNGR